MGKGTGLIAALGLSAMLSSADAQSKDIDLKAIHADSIAITTLDGRIVLKQGSEPTTPSRSTPRSGSGQTVTTNDTPSRSSRVRGNNTGSTNSVTNTTTISSLEDCKTITETFVEKAASTTSRRSRAPSQGESEKPSYIATCFNDGKKVATIKVDHGNLTLELEK